MIIIQARMASTRLRGKVLLPLAGVSVLAHVLARCAAVTNAKHFCCAIPCGAENDPIALEAEAFGALVVRGPQEDVLARYLKAATEIDADPIMRVTSDCPVIDPEICESVLGALISERADFACNNAPRAWPHGLDCEAFTLDALRQADVNATEHHDREHVTPWIRRNANMKRLFVTGPDTSLAQHRWTLDYLEDYHFFKALFAYMPPVPQIMRFPEVLKIVEAHPEIAAINAQWSEDVASTATKRNPA